MNTDQTNLINSLGGLDNTTSAMGGITTSSLQNIGIVFLVFIIVLTVSIILKGYSMWYSARNNQKWWFISLLTINTMGILDVIYLIFFRNKKVPEKTIKEVTETTTVETTKVRREI